MKKYLAYLLGCMLCMPWTISCSQDDFQMTEAAPSSCIVSAVTLGTLPSIIKLKTAEGKDSVIAAKVTGAYYPMTIDHLAGRIFNIDSLPYGTDVSKVTFLNLSASGPLGIRSLVAEGDTLFVPTDSTDFRQPRLVTVFAYDGLASRSYNMEVRVHKQEGDSFVWNKVCGNVEAIQNMEMTGAITTEDSLFAFGKKNGVPVVGKMALAAPAEWQVAAISHAVSAPVKFAEKYYAISEGSVVVASDLTTWTPLAGAPAQVLAMTALDNALVVATAEGFYSSADGAAWVSEEADEPQYLPGANVAMAYKTSATDATYVETYAVGNTTNGPVLWKHNVDLTGAETYVWNYYPDMAFNPYPCPDLKGRQLFGYDDKLLQTGMDQEGKFRSYLSSDGGRTWRSNVLGDVAQSANQVSVTVGQSHWVWVISDAGEVYKGRFNRLGWQRPDVVFK